MNAILEVVVLVSITAAACSLPGTFLMLRGVALMSDAISHAVLPGIVIMFLLMHDLNSWWLLLGAAFAACGTVFITEMLIQTERLKKDAAIGLMYPLAFSLGIILISMYARTVHLDVDMVFLGEVAFAPFQRYTIYGVDIGPKALWTMSAILVLNILYIALAYKELTVAIFDGAFAQVAGFYPRFLYAILIIITSITAVGAFDVVGSIVVVALMITPAAIGSILVYRMHNLLIIAVCASILSAVLGTWVALVLDVSIAGCIAAMSGVLFFVALVFSDRGLYVYIDRYNTHRRAHAIHAVTLFLSAHEMSTQQKISDGLGWHKKYAAQILVHALAQGVIERNKEGMYFLRSGTPQLF